MSMQQSPGIGHNEAPDYAQQVTERMQGDYAEVVSTVTSLLEEARNLPAAVDDDETLGTYAKLIKRLRDTAARVEAFRVKEKEPFLRGGNAVDGFFNGLAAKLARAKRTDKPGALDVLAARVDSYMQRKLAEEQARRQAAAAEAARVAREAQERAAKEAREAEERRLAAERARLPATQEAKGAVAAAAEASATSSGIEAALASGAAEDAHIATLAKPADIARTRVDDALITMPEEPYAELVDAALLDKAILWPFISEDAKAKALRAWAKTTGHRTQMAGALIGRRPKTSIR